MHAVEILSDRRMERTEKRMREDEKGREDGRGLKPMVVGDRPPAC